MNFAVIAGWLFSCSNVLIWSVLFLNSFLCLSLSGRGCRVSDGVPAGWALLRAVTTQRTRGRSDCHECASNAAAFRVFWCSFSKHPSTLWIFFSLKLWISSLFVSIILICICPSASVLSWSSVQVNEPGYSAEVKQVFLQTVLARGDLSSASVSDSELSVWLTVRLRPLLSALSSADVPVYFGTVRARGCSIKQEA